MSQSRSESPEVPKEGEMRDKWEHHKRQICNHRGGTVPMRYQRKERWGTNENITNDKVEITEAAQSPLGTKERRDEGQMRTSQTTNLQSQRRHSPHEVPKEGEMRDKWGHHKHQIWNYRGGTVPMRYQRKERWGTNENTTNAKFEISDPQTNKRNRGTVLERSVGKLLGD